MRVTSGGTYACFESTDEGVLAGDRVKNMLAVLRPDRFTIIVLADPQCGTAKALSQKKAIGVEPDNFSEYSLLNRTVNEFAPGYVVVQMSYTR
jgi:S-adenosylmethionine decarboxylase